MGLGSAVLVGVRALGRDDASALPRPARAAATTRTLLLASSLLIAAAHASLLGDWLIDDAGISFAYARNLALGHGLVSQPGALPVEGFSNPLWTLLLAPFFALGAFDPVWTPKLLSLALLAVVFFGIVRSAGDGGGALWLAGLPAVLLALDTSFVIWTTSGLENALLAALLVVSATLAMGAGSARHELAAGVVAGLLALTRPDAVVYAPGYVLALAWARPDVRSFIVRSARYALGFVLAFGPYLAFRRLYFGDWVPNTFHAKVRPWMLIADPSRLLELVTAGTGRAAWVVLLVAAAGVGIVVARRRLSLRTFVLAGYATLAAAAYLLLPPDWMGEFRFATGFFLFFYWLIGEIAATLWTAVPRARWLVAAAVLLLSAETAVVHATRTTQFAAAPTVPFERIGDFAKAYDRLAASLGPERASLLTPDLGGMLYHAHLEVYDLAGLCDRTVARTLMGDTPAFHDYVFETVRPTFIHIHGTWSGWAGFHRDPRFTRDYVALHENWDVPPETSLQGEPWSGDYVRREAIDGEAALALLKARFEALGLHKALP